MENFRRLGVCEEILKVLEELKFERPSEIQEKTIPLVVTGKDVIACAATGSGKTLAFGSAIINQCKAGDGIQALVLTPTRELAHQVKESLQRFSSYKELNFCEVYGGVSYNPQIPEIKRSEVVVGTPGRILDHLSQKTLCLANIKILVLDEADRMLDMGFILDIKKIIKECNKNRQTLLFSATINGDVFQIAKEFMRDPQEISAEKNVDPKKLKQVYYDVMDHEKFSLLVHLLKNDPSQLVMVFCNTKRNTDFIATNLRKNGIKALAIHGGHSQNKRTNTMDKFIDMDFQVLVCTDVAARGLDIKNVSHVYNYDSPLEISQYVHRIGRTARVGKEGKAITILGSRDYENFGRVKNEHPEISREETPQFEKAEMERRDRLRVARIDGRDRGRPDRHHGRFSNRRASNQGRNRFGIRGFNRDMHRNGFQRDFRENGRSGENFSRRSSFSRHRNPRRNTLQRHFERN